MLGVVFKFRRKTEKPHEDYDRLHGLLEFYKDLPEGDPQTEMFGCMMGTYEVPSTHQTQEGADKREPRL